MSFPFSRDQGIWETNLFQAFAKLENIFVMSESPKNKMAAIHLEKIYKTHIIHQS